MERATSVALTLPRTLRTAAHQNQFYLLVVYTVSAAALHRLMSQTIAVPQPFTAIGD
jgi:hypothetical protein